MVALRLPVFGGMIPSIDKHLLSEKNAAHSENTWLYSGALRGLPQDVFLHKLANPTAMAAFRIPESVDDPTYMYNSSWMEFENPNTSFLAAPVAGDEFRRFYWTSKSTPPMYNTLLRIRNGQPPYFLGLPQGPNVSVSPTGGSSTTMVSRAYVTTLVTQFGEEGPAGTPVLVNGKLDDTFAVTVQGVAANNINGTDRVVNRIRVYRTITSNQGTTTYYLVSERTAQTGPQSFNDTMSDATLASRTILESTAWTAPPWLEGFVAMPNGIIAGWMGKELWFSEAYRPHAWPAAYSLTLEYDIVGLGVIAQTLVVCTKGAPYTASGVNPASMTTAKLASFEPCLSQGSIVSSEDGVFYTSPNGLIMVTPGVAQNLTRQIVSRDKWHELANQAKVRAARIGTAYYAYGAGVARVFQDKPEAFQTNMIQTLNEEGLNAGFVIDATNENASISMLNAARYVRNLQNDVWSGEVLSIIDGNVYWLNQEPDYRMRPYKWKSKSFQLPVAKNFAAFKLYFDPTGDPNPAPNYSLEQNFNPEVQDVLVRVYANGKLIAAREVVKSGELHRLPTGFIAEFWEIEFEARTMINNFQMSTSVKELTLA